MDIPLMNKLAIIQTELKAKKSRFNAFGKYNFRSAEDILEAIKPFLLKLDVSVWIEEKYLGEHIIQSTAIISDGVQKIKATAVVGVESEQKGMQMPQRFGSASSYGKKYSLGNLFLIDDTQDSDALNTHDKTQKPTLVKNTPNYQKVVDAIKKGFSIDDVKKKYVVSNDVVLDLELLNK